MSSSTPGGTCRRFRGYGDVVCNFVVVDENDLIIIPADRMINTGLSMTSLVVAVAVAVVIDITHHGSCKRRLAGARQTAHEYNAGGRWLLMPTMLR